MTSEPESAPVAEPGHRSRAHSAYIVIGRMLVGIRRTLVLSSLMLALYVMVGSLFFSDWWYAFFWLKGYRYSSFVVNGLFSLIDNHFWLSIGTFVAFLAAVVLGSILKRHVFRLIDL